MGKQGFLPWLGNQSRRKTPNLNQLNSVKKIELMSHPTRVEGLVNTNILYEYCMKVKSINFFENIFR